MGGTRGKMGWVMESLVIEAEMVVDKDMEAVREEFTEIEMT